MTLNLFQIVAVSILVALLVLTIVASFRRWVNRREALSWGAVWVVAGVAVVWPEVTAVIARTLGIGRGADLLIYCTAAVMMIGFMMTYVRLRRLRRDLTLLVRSFAIRDAFIADGAGSPDTE